MSQPVHRITAPAEIDPSTVEFLVDELERASDDAIVEVDCSEVTFMDSAGVRALSMAAQRHEAGGGNLCVIRPSDVVRRILEVTALATLIADAGEATET